MVSGPNSTYKNADEGKVAAAESPSERKQTGGGGSTKVEAAKRRKRKYMRRYKGRCDIFF